MHGVRMGEGVPEEMLFRIFHVLAFAEAALAPSMQDLSTMSSPESAHSSAPQSPLPDKLKRLPASAAAAFVAFRDKGDEAALTELIIAVLTDHAPDKAAAVKEWRDDLRLIEDIGFDSLAIAETVFFFEDLFGITISNEEIMQVRTLGELRAFVNLKASALKA